MSQTGTIAMYRVLSEYKMITCFHKFYEPEDLPLDMNLNMGHFHDCLHNTPRSPAHFEYVSSRPPSDMRGDSGIDWGPICQNWANFPGLALFPAILR